MSARGPKKASLAAVDASDSGVAAGRAIPDAPGDLGAAGLVVWERVWSEPQIQEGDRLAVGRLRRLEDEAASLRAVLAEDGPVSRRPVQNSKGDVIGEEAVAHPLLVPLRKVGSETTALCNALGLTPSGRRALGLEILEPEPPDWLDELRASRALRQHRAMNGERSWSKYGP